MTPTPDAEALERQSSSIPTTEWTLEDWRNCAHVMMARAQQLELEALRYKCEVREARAELEVAEQFIGDNPAVWKKFQRWLKAKLPRSKGGAPRILPPEREAQVSADFDFIKAELSKQRSAKVTDRQVVDYVISVVTGNHTQGIEDFSGQPRDHRDAFRKKMVKRMSRYRRAHFGKSKNPREK